jgi:hypothetical protein
MEAICSSETSVDFQRNTRRALLRSAASRCEPRSVHGAVSPDTKRNAASAVSSVGMQDPALLAYPLTLEEPHTRVFKRLHLFRMHQ